MKAFVLGFGANHAPEPLLNVLSKAVAVYGVSVIELPTSSQQLKLALLKEPYGTFLFNEVKEDKNPPEVVLFCLPSTASYVGSEQVHHDTKFLREILWRKKGTVVAVYSIAERNFLGGDENTVLNAIGGDIHARESLAAASLSALGGLDSEVAVQFGPSKQQDVVVLVGSGGREHALAVAIARSPLVSRVICCPGNDGTAAEGGKISNAEGVNVNQDSATVLDIVKRVGAQTVVVGPEDLLFDGLVDQLRTENPDLRVFGPSKAAAQFVGSKEFIAKGLDELVGSTTSDANTMVESLIQNVLDAVEAPGYPADNGVQVVPSLKDRAINGNKEIISSGGDGTTSVIKSSGAGPEVSCIAWCDGTTVFLFPAVQHCQGTFASRMGGITGNMAAYSPARCVMPCMRSQIQETCAKIVLEMQQERGTPYIGILCIKFMFTPIGPVVLQCKCCFDEVSAQVLLPRMESDVYEAIVACCDGVLGSTNIHLNESMTSLVTICAADQSDVVAIETLANKNDTVQVCKNGIADDSGKQLLAVTALGKHTLDALDLIRNVLCAPISVGSDECIAMPQDEDEGDIITLGMLRLGIVLGSAGGSALHDIHNVCTGGQLQAEIVAVITDDESAPILAEKGLSLGGTTTKLISPKGLSQTQYEAKITDTLFDIGVDLVLLVEYGSTLTDSFAWFWGKRCLNATPSLLLEQSHDCDDDLDLYENAIVSGETETGCTIHDLSVGAFGGPVFRKNLPIEEGENSKSLKAKVQLLEGPAFVEAIERLCQGTYSNGS